MKHRVSNWSWNSIDRILESIQSESKKQNIYKRKLHETGRKTILNNLKEELQKTENIKCIKIDINVIELITFCTFVGNLSVVPTSLNLNPSFM